MWRAIRHGTATGTFALEEANAFGPTKPTHFVYEEVRRGRPENQSLNRWGMNFVRGKSYEGYRTCALPIPQKCSSRWKVVTAGRCMPSSG